MAGGLRLGLLLAVAVAAVAGQQDYAEQMESLAQRHAGDMRASARADPEGQRREAMAQQMLADMLRDVGAMLDHGSPTAKEAAVARLLQMAVQSSAGSMFHPTTFRNAAIRSGVVPKIIKLMQVGSDHAKYLGAGALQALALDDPTTTLDNGHQVRAPECAGCAARLAATNGTCYRRLRTFGLRLPLASAQRQGSGEGKTHAVIRATPLCSVRRLRSAKWARCLCSWRC